MPTLDYSVPCDCRLQAYARDQNMNVGDKELSDLLDFSAVSVTITAPCSVSLSSASLGTLG